MAKYVDLSLAGSGHAGTDIDPFSYPDFKADVETAGAETYNLKGEKETVDDFFNSKNNQVYQAWNSLSYGPFRLRDISADNFSLKGLWDTAILEIGNDSTKGTIETCIMYGCMLKCYCEGELAPGQEGLIYGDTCIFKGCTLQISILTQVNIGILECTDCVVNVGTWAKGEPPP